MKYFVTFIDDYSRCFALFFLKHKSKVLEKFKEFEALATNLCDEKIRTLRTDNGGEYLSAEFEAYLKSKGIRHELSVPYSPEQNGVAERMNGTLVESARSVITHAGLSIVTGQRQLQQLHMSEIVHLRMLSKNIRHPRAVVW